MTKQDNIESLKQQLEEMQYKLFAAYSYIEQTTGSYALDMFKKATNKEYAVIKTDEMLTIHEPLAFEKKRKRGRPRKGHSIKDMRNPEYWIDNRSFEEFERDYINNTQYN